MNDATVYAKTALGQREIEQRSAGLELRHRRLLILVDGRRSVAELRGLPGAGEVSEGLALLLQRGLVAASGATGPATVPVAAPPGGGPAGSGAQGHDWHDRRRRAVRALAELLGPAGDGMAMRLEALKSAEDLPALLERARGLVADARGSAQAERFDAMLGG